jgi:hypothetical protein
MALQESRSAGRESGRSIGTLWIVTRGDSTARCVLIKMSDGLELRVLLDESPLRTRECDTHSEAFELAECWRERMMARGWVVMRRAPSV